MGVSERLTVSFADADAQIQGVAIAGVGTLLKLGEQLTAAAPPLFAPDDGSWRVSSPEGFELSLASWGHGTALSEGGTFVCPCGATGIVGSSHFDGLAMLSRAPADSEPGFALERSLAILFDPQLTFALSAGRRQGADGHGEEQLAAVAFRGEPLEPVAIEKPRLSSTYDAESQLTHAGLELWESEESEFALRIGGEALAHGELRDPDGALTRVSFIAWHHDGRHGLGSYAIRSTP